MDEFTREDILKNQEVIAKRMKYESLRAHSVHCSGELHIMCARYKCPYCQELRLRKQQRHTFRTKSLILLLFLTVFVLLFSKWASADQYIPDKLSVETAKAHCQSLVFMTKPVSDAGAMLSNVHEKINGESVKGQKILIISYRYNIEGAGYFCAFVDYSRGSLQLAEFGEVWPAGNKATTSKKLY